MLLQMLQSLMKMMLVLTVKLAPPSCQTFKPPRNALQLLHSRMASECSDLGFFKWAFLMFFVFLFFLFDYCIFPFRSQQLVIATMVRRFDLWCVLNIACWCGLDFQEKIPAKTLKLLAGCDLNHFLLRIEKAYMGLNGWMSMVFNRWSPFFESCLNSKKYSVGGFEMKGEHSRSVMEEYSGHTCISYVFHTSSQRYL